MSTPYKAGTPSLFSRTRSALLALFYGRVDRQYHFRQLARVVGGGHSSLQRELKALTELGLVIFTPQGNQTLYRANKKSPIFGEMKRLVAKTVGVHDAVRAGLASLGSRITVAFVYGSIARQREKGESDIDLMVLGEVSFAEVISSLSGTQKAVGREINPSVYSPDDFRDKLKAGNHFLRSVLKEPKLFIVGSEHELAELGAERVVGRT